MASELKLPLAGMIDLACAALCNPRSPGFNHALPVVVIDLTLDGAGISPSSSAGKNWPGAGFFSTCRHAGSPTC